MYLLLDPAHAGRVRPEVVVEVDHAALLASAGVARVPGGQRRHDAGVEAVLERVLGHGKRIEDRGRIGFCVSPLVWIIDTAS